MTAVLMSKAKVRDRKPGKDLLLDNSIVMAWSFEDDIDEYADTVLDRPATPRSIVSALWPLEVANALST
jgi:hypothetical protein